MTAVAEPFFAEMVAASNFSFLRGASKAEWLVLQSLLLGHAGIGIADRNTVAGVVRAYAALKDIGERFAGFWKARKEGTKPKEDEEDEATRLLRLWAEAAADAGLGEALPPFTLVVGARLVFADGTPDIVAHAQDRDGWGRLCRLLTVGNLRGAKGECILKLDDLLADARGLSLILMPPRSMPAKKLRRPRLACWRSSARRRPARSGSARAWRARATTAAASPR